MERPNPLAVRLLPDTDEFRAAAAPFLLRDEAAHNLMLGLSARPGLTTDYLAVVERSGTVVLAAMMTRGHNLIVSQAADPAALRVLAHDLMWRPVVPPGVRGPTAESAAFARAWHQLTGAMATRTMAERIYALERVMPVRGVLGRMRRATEADRPLLLDWMRGFCREALHDPAERDAEHLVSSRLAGNDDAVFYLWEDAEPVSAASINGPTPRGIKIGPVYTPPPARGHGYASAVVAALSQLQLDLGRRWCFLFTDLANPTSNHIYQAVGYLPVCDVDEYRFSSPPVSSDAPARS